MTDQFFLFLAIGFAAQLVDGAIGMAYGLSATSIMLSMGTPMSVASASVHAAEVFTTGISGFAHWRLKNVDLALFKRLVIPGMVGGGVGAYVLSSVSGEAIRPFVSMYLLGMALLIFYKAIRLTAPAGVPQRHVRALGLVGGFLDAVGGGGWGPMVTSTLVGRGAEPRLAIGSVNLAEFFVTLTISATFVATIGLQLWPIISGMVVGGVLAAPLAAYVTRFLPAKWTMMLVALVIMGLSLRDLMIRFG
ncbi:MAG: sulfite exporter TauE/SafE family protein [Rickettsiales bacterium]|nr:sulfite exporter TauE/SafE family protein [Rickettsiales bacterium]